MRRIPDDDGTEGFFATSWSPDGTKIAGYIASESNVAQALAIYEPGSRRFLRRVDVAARGRARNSASTVYVVWLPDSRHVCYVTLAGNALMVLDTDTGDAFAVAPDGRTLFYGGSRQEADIWIVEKRPLD